MYGGDCMSFRKQMYMLMMLLSVVPIFVISGLAILMFELYLTAVIFVLVVLMLVVALIIIVTILYKRLSLYVMTPVDALQDAFHRAVHNRIYAPCKTVKGSSEFTKLVEEFNTMIKSINSHRSDMEETLESLRISEDELRRHNGILRKELDRSQNQADSYSL
jgi:nitrate/nitrite-specific signal transduction histidine kinase